MKAQEDLSHYTVKWQATGFHIRCSLPVKECLGHYSLCRSYPQQGWVFLLYFWPPKRGLAAKNSSHAYTTNDVITAS